MIPLVSVCMTTYNHAPYIAQAIESVLMQRTDFAVEIVIGEDCSTDNTLTICQHYQTLYPDIVRVVTGSSNIGMRANYRRTIAACRGKYVAMCDGDDYFTDPEKLQLQVDLLENNPEIAMCYTRSERKGDSSSEIYPSGALHTTFEDMLRLNTAENCTTVALREKIEQYYTQIDPLSHSEWLTDDLPMWLWFSATQQIAAIDRVTAVHRLLDTSVSHSRNYHKTIAFCYSLHTIMLWYDNQYNNSRMRSKLLTLRQNTELWTLSHHGGAKEFISRWYDHCKNHPRLLLNIAPYGLFIKSLFRRKK